MIRCKIYYETDDDFVNSNDIYNIICCYDQTLTSSIMPITKLFMTISDYKLFVPIHQEAFLKYWFMFMDKF
jgi:hypothetical protein